MLTLEVEQLGPPPYVCFEQVHFQVKLRAASNDLTQLQACLAGDPGPLRGVKPVESGPLLGIKPGTPRYPPTPQVCCHRSLLTQVLLCNSHEQHIGAKCEQAPGLPP